MSMIEDELVVAAEQLLNDLPSASETIRDSVISAVASTVIPFGIGSALTNIVNDTADRNWRAQVYELIRMFGERIARLTGAIDDRSYYHGPEFRTLFIEAIEQERTNRFEFKRKMLAQGLAQSGTRTFIRELDKETFFRILRDISPADMHALKELATPTNKEHLGLLLKEQTLERVRRASLVDPRIYRLQGYGLVTTISRLPPPGNVSRIQDQGALNTFITNALKAEPQVYINISDFGKRFLAFLLEEPSGEATDSVDPL